jgi:hypothetical protein
MLPGGWDGCPLGLSYVGCVARGRAPYWSGLGYPLTPLSQSVSVSFFFPLFALFPLLLAAGRENTYRVAKYRRIGIE